MGRYLDFAELTEQALDYAIKQVVPQHSSLKSQLLAAYRHLEAYQDVRTALSQFKARGAKLAILSNGSPEMLKSVITSNQLSELLDVVLSVDAVVPTRLIGCVRNGGSRTWREEGSHLLPLVESLGCCGRGRVWPSRRLGQPDQAARRVPRFGARSRGGDFGGTGLLCGVGTARYSSRYDRLRSFRETCARASAFARRAHRQSRKFGPATRSHALNRRLPRLGRPYRSVPCDE